MPLSALALVILAGLIRASWNIAAKKAGGDVRFAAFTGIVMMIFWAPLGIWLGRDQIPAWGRTEWSLVTASALLHTLYFIVLLRGYRKADLTVVYPLARGSGPLLSSLAAIVVLGEQISALGAAGIAGVVAGVFLIAGGPGLWKAAHDPERRKRINKGMLYGLVTGVFIASYTVVDGYAVKIVLMSPILVDYMGNLLRLVVLVPTVLRDLPAAVTLWQRQWKYATFVGIISPVSYVLVLYAMQTAPLSHVAPAREVSMLFAALIGGQLLGEGDRGMRLLGAAFIAAGVMALAEFGNWLSQPRSWLGAFDFPFGLPRELIEHLHWPLRWRACMDHYASLTRAEIRDTFAAFCDARPVGGKFAHRAFDKIAGSSPSMKWVNPPVAFMLHAAVPLLLAAGVNIPGLHGGDQQRVALEAYPGLLARELLGRRSYKADDKARQTPERLIARKDLVTALEMGQSRLGLRLKLTHAQRDALVHDASGDSLDAVLCLLQAAWAQRQGAPTYGLPDTMDPLEGWIVSAGA